MLVIAMMHIILRVFNAIYQRHILYSFTYILDLIDGVHSDCATNYMKRKLSDAWR